jgi:hypothetical protein
VQSNTLPTAAYVLWTLAKLYIFMLKVNNVDAPWQPTVVYKKIVIDQKT